MNLKILVPSVIAFLLAVNYGLAYSAWRAGQKAGMVAGLASLIGANVISLAINVGMFYLLLKKTDVKNADFDIVVENVSGMFVSVLAVVSIVGLIGLMATVASAYGDSSLKGSNKLSVVLIAPLGIVTLLGSAKLMDVVLKKQNPVKSREVNDVMYSAWARARGY